MSNLVKRTLSGAVFVAVVIGSIWLHPYIYAVMMLAVIVWSMLEFYDIVIKDRVRTGKLTGVLIGVSLFTASFFYVQDVVSGDVFLFFIPLLVFLFSFANLKKEHYLCVIVPCLILLSRIAYQLKY